MKKAFLSFSPTAKAVIYMIIAAVFLTALDAFAKQLTKSHHTLQVVWARYFFQILWAVLLLAPRVPQLMKTDHLGLQLLRSALLFGATMFFFFALNWMPLSDVAAIFEVAPLLITIFAFVILKERIGPRRWWGVAFGLLGAVIIIRPGSEVFSVTSLVPMGSAACFAAYVIATRVLGQGESPWTSFLYTALIGTLIASLFAPFYWSQPTAINWVLMIIMGGVAGIGHYCLIKAFTLSDASFLAPFSYLNVFFNTIWGFLFFYEIPSIYTVIGASIIISAGIYVWYRENKSEKQRVTEVSELLR
jgi:drug/metabolite transporter (DMT)-like permease